MMGQGSQESADIVLGENANLEHYLGGAANSEMHASPKKFGAIVEHEMEDSSPNVRPSLFPSDNKLNNYEEYEQPVGTVNLDMNNFVLLSER